MHNPNHSMQKMAELYKSGKMTMSKAACDADMSIWDFEQYMVRHGYKSQYSVEDLQRELKELGPSRKIRKR